jgi:hypothetical protein
VACAIDGRADEDVALERGERGHPGERRPRLEPLFDLLVNLLFARRVGHLVGHGDRDPKVVEADVVRDAIEPWPDLTDLSPGAQRLPCLKERLLEGILGRAGVRLEAAAVGEQLPPIPADESLEGRLVPFARELDQPAVRLRLQKVE